MIIPAVNRIAYLVVESPRTRLAKAAYACDPIWLVPSFWRSEFLNILATSVRTGRLDEGDAVKAWETAVATVGKSGRGPSPLAVLGLAVAKGISACDAQYVVPAQTVEACVVTADKKLVKCFPETAAMIDDFARGA